MRLCLLAAMMLSALIFSSAQAGEKKTTAKTEKAESKDNHLYVIPPTGLKEAKLADWHFTLGTERFALSTDTPVNPKGKVGPEYLKFREEDSTNWVDGVMTLIPLQSIRKIDYDNKKKTVAVTVAEANGKDEVLTGTTAFAGINKIAIEGKAIFDGLDSAKVKFQGGFPNGIHGARFPPAKPVEPVKGAAVVIVAKDKKKSYLHTVHDLQPLYLVANGFVVMPELTFKKTVKIAMDKVAKLRHLPSADNKQVDDCEVTLRDGTKETLTLLTTIEIEKKKLDDGTTQLLPQLLFRKTIKIEPEKIARLRMLPAADEKKLPEDFEVTMRDGSKLNLTLLSKFEQNGKAVNFVGLVGRVPAGFKIFPPHLVQELRFVNGDK